MERLLAQRHLEKLDGLIIYSLELEALLPYSFALILGSKKSQDRQKQLNKKYRNR